MLLSKKTYYKAFLLLIVFSMNTVVSFACSFGGLFHGLHHSQSSQSHHAEKDVPAGHGHDHAPEADKAHHHDAREPGTPNDDNCCSEELIAIEKVDKSVPQAITAPSTNFLTSFIAAYGYLFLSYPADIKAHYPHGIRWRSPTTISDLRIVIQSFQI